MIIAKIVGLLRSARSIPFISFLIGLGTAVMLFHKPIQTTPTLAMPVADVEKNVVNYGGKCFRYHAEDCKCEIPTSK